MTESRGAPELISHILDRVKAAYERAKTTGDRDLLDSLSEARESMLELREKQAALEAEKAELIRRVEAAAPDPLAPALVRHTGVYWAQGDPDPWCPSCWETDRKALHLNPTGLMAGRMVECRRCHYSINLDNVTPPKKG
jgi:hypothetical protein